MTGLCGLVAFHVGEMWHGIRIPLIPRGWSISWEIGRRLHLFHHEIDYLYANICYLTTVNKLRFEIKAFKLLVCDDWKIDIFTFH